MPVPLTPAPAEAAAQSAAATQAFIGLGSLAEAGQIGAAGLNGVTAGLLTAEAAAFSGLANLGLLGPYPGTTPINAALNVQFASLVNAMLGQLAAVGAAQSFLGLGTSAMLANSGRNFLVSTYWGL